MKSQLRKELRRRRRAFDPLERARRSKLAAAAVTRLPQFKAGARVAIYLPFDGETDTSDLIAAARRRRVRIFTPVIVDRRHGRIRFQPLTGRTRRGVFGIHVPSRKGRPIEPRWFNLMVVPLVGVDHAGHRLGFGGGYYDRALAFRRTRLRWPGPRLVGLCFGCQKVPTVHAQPWDARLDAIATEAGLELFPIEDGECK
jgi:5-formyltetrahydrofolate cyclo-ligase